MAKAHLGEKSNKNDDDDDEEESSKEESSKEQSSKEESSKEEPKKTSPKKHFRVTTVVPKCHVELDLYSEERNLKSPPQSTRRIKTNI